MKAHQQGLGGRRETVQRIGTWSWESVAFIEGQNALDLDREPRTSQVKRERWRWRNPTRRARRALASIFEYNYHQPMRDYYNPCWVYSLNDEGGLVIAHWPEDKYKPMIPLPYSQETQNGYEYAAAIQMIQSDLVEEGMTAVAAIRDRYDGEKRNPWNEFECGNNYARSMATYALLNAFSGFRFAMVRGIIGFIRPNRARENHSSDQHEPTPVAPPFPTKLFCLPHRLFKLWCRHYLHQL